MSTVRLVWDVGAQLGEGPIWVAEEAALRFVDIKSGALHRYDPATDTCETALVGGAPSFIVPRQGGGFLIGTQHHIAALVNNSLAPPVVTLDHPAHNRTNDATVDCHGRLWFGTMDDHETQPTGQFYCLDGGTLHALGGHAIVTNGPAVSADGQWLYQVDSASKTIWRSEIIAGPRLVNRAAFVQLGSGDGHPDGVVLDSEDCLWVALWDGWGVRRYAPDGTLLEHIDLPCARVTKIAFGGEDLRTAYVTTARTGLSQAELVRQPLAGGLFAFEVAVPGRTLPAAAL
jgi:xylono-1,5-lactonase